MSSERSNLSHRAAALPAMSVLAATADAAANPDTELVALGDQFVALMKRWLPLDAEQRVRGWEAHAKAWKLAGVDNPDNLTPEDAEKFFEHLGPTSDETGFTKFERAAEVLHHQMESIARRIMDLPAHSINGLRAKAMVALYGSMCVWKLSEMEDDYGARTIRSLIEAFGGPVHECLELAELSEAKAEDAAEEREDRDGTLH